MKKTVLECDVCGNDIPKGDNYLHIQYFLKSENNSYNVDLCSSCSDKALRYIDPNSWKERKIKQGFEQIK